MERFAVVPYDFNGKTVLDIGSNQGGMLHPIADRIRWGAGIDYDSRLVNVANWIARAKGTPNLAFYVFNLETDPLDLLEDILPEPKVDICFLLSVCMWIKNWRDVIDAAQTISEAMLFESNGKPEQQDEQIAYLQTKYRTIQQLTDASLDDPGQSKRRLYLLSDPIR